MKAVIGMQIVFLYITKKAVQAIREPSKRLIKLIIPEVWLLIRNR